MRRIHSIFQMPRSVETWWNFFAVWIQTVVEHLANQTQHRRAVSGKTVPNAASMLVQSQARLTQVRVKHQLKIHPFKR